MNNIIAESIQRRNFNSGIRTRRALNVQQFIVGIRIGQRSSIIATRYTVDDIGLPVSGMGKHHLGGILNGTACSPVIYSYVGFSGIRQVKVSQSIAGTCIGFNG